LFAKFFVARRQFITNFSRYIKWYIKRTAAKRPFKPFYICLLHEEKIMTEVLAVFRARSQAVDCNNRLKNFGIAASIITTPKEANVGCGLSVKIPQNSLPRARAIISSAKYTAFYGYYTMQNLYGRIYIVRM